MESNRPSKAKPRRDFFKNAALLAAAALFAGRRGTAAPTAGTPLPPPSGGYRLTAHIRRYYERAAL